MSLGAMFVGLALFALVIPFVANPFMQKNGRRGSTISTRKKTEAPDRYTETLSALRDLDFDQRTGKITKEDYDILRAELLIRASGELETKKQLEMDLDSKLERAILARKKEKLSTKACKKCGKKLNATDLFCSDCGEPSQPFCQNCGHELQVDDMFCVGCGQSTKSVHTAKTEAVS